MQYHQKKICCIPLIAFLLICISILSLSTPVILAQNTEYENWKSNYQSDFNNYSDSLNKAFNQFLDKTWVEIGFNNPIKSYNSPKPVDLPSLIPPVEDSKNEITSRPIIKLPEPNDARANNSSMVELRFYGLNWSLDLIPLGANFTNKSTFSESDIASFWKTAEKQVNQLSIKYLKDEIATRQLSDWASYQLVRSWLDAHQNLNDSERRLYSWYYMQQMGYDIRLGLSSNQVVLLLAFDEPLYSINYYTLDGRKYYQLEADGKSIQIGRIKTYDGIAGRPLHWMESAPADIGQKSEVISKKFSYKEQSFDFELPVNQYRIAFLNQLPRSRPELYGQIQPESSFSSSLDKQFETIFSGKSELEKAQFLLSFVQLAFDYKTDEQQFGKEKFMSPEETFWYPSSDCEDRSALYAWLLNRYTSINFVFIRYPSHIAIALKEEAEKVNRSQLSQTDGYSKNGSYFIISDPTYRGAQIGMEMPKLKSQGRIILP